MKKMLVSFLLLICIIVMTSCNHELIKENQSVSKTYQIGDEYVDIVLYDANADILEEIREVYDYYYKLFDRHHSYDNIVNVHDINNKKSIIVNDELANIIKYAQSIENELNGHFNILAGELQNLWDKACEEKKRPADEAIAEAMSNMNKSNLKIEGNNVSIVGNALLDLSKISRGYANNKVCELLEKNKIDKYIINYYSRNITIGEALSKDEYKLSLYGVANGYYRINNNSISTIGNDINYFDADGRKYTNVIDCLTGYPLDIYDKVFVLGNDMVINDILCYISYNLDLEVIKELESKFDISLLIYNDLNLVYQGSTFEKLFID